MPAAAELNTKPVTQEDVPKVDDAVAVGEDMGFQSRWWFFERIVWSFFVLVLIADLAGALGRGPLANARRKAPDGTLDVRYERVERANSSSIMTISPLSPAIHDGTFKLYVSDSIVKQLGAQRVIPAPKDSVIGSGGVTYTFEASNEPMLVQIELKPSFVGLQHFVVATAGGQPVTASTFVLP